MDHETPPLSPYSCPKCLGGSDWQGGSREDLWLVCLHSDPVWGSLCSTVAWKTCVLSSFLISWSSVQDQLVSSKTADEERSTRFRILALFFTGFCDLRSLSFSVIYNMDKIMRSCAGSWQRGLNEMLFAMLPALSMVCSMSLIFSCHLIPFCLLSSFLMT